MESINFQVMLLDSDNQLIVNDRFARKTLSIGASPDADINCSECVDCFFYIHSSSDRSVVLFENKKTRSSHSKVLQPGLLTEIGGYKILIVNQEGGASEGSSDRNLIIRDRVSVAIERIMAWSLSSMGTLEGLRAGLAEFLEICGATSQAINGMIILRDEQGFDIVSTYRLTNEQASNIWESMPKAILDEIESKQARSILPEGLAQKVSDETTVFVEDVKSLAGFPILAEGKLVGILYLGFDNLIKSLSTSAQKGLEFCCCMAGLIIQRAILRNEISQLKMHRSNEEMWIHELPKDRLMIGSSEKLAEVYRFIKRVAPVAVPTLINGETGTGKELAAQEIHRSSGRADKSFVAVNASALPESLFESELFGHKKGAFSGAITDHVGYIEQANGGTLFIDEIAEIPLNLQSKLLRVLQEKQIVRVGDTKVVDVDFRLVCATHCDLQQRVDEGLFREDLYYRIAGAILKMPSLRDRRSDIFELANFFKQRFVSTHKMASKHFSIKAMNFLEHQSWPGNIRQLENVITRACVMSEGAMIERKDIEPFIDGAVITGTEIDEDFSSNALKPVPLSEAKDKWMRDYLMRSLQYHNGNKAKTALALGIGQRTLFRYLEQLELKTMS